jgi:hypothetical protein
MYLLASSLTAALLDGLFEHPVVVEAAMPIEASLPRVLIHRVFPQPANPSLCAIPAIR